MEDFYQNDHQSTYDRDTSNFKHENSSLINIKEYEQIFDKATRITKNLTSDFNIKESEKRFQSLIKNYNLEQNVLIIGPKKSGRSSLRELLSQFLDPSLKATFTDTDFSTSQSSKELFNAVIGSEVIIYVAPLDGTATINLSLLEILKSANLQGKAFFIVGNKLLDLELGEEFNRYIISRKREIEKLPINENDPSRTRANKIFHFNFLSEKLLNDFQFIHFLEDLTFNLKFQFKQNKINPIDTALQEYFSVIEKNLKQEDRYFTSENIFYRNDSINCKLRVEQAQADKNKIDYKELVVKIIEDLQKQFIKDLGFSGLKQIKKDLGALDLETLVKEENENLDKTVKDQFIKTLQAWAERWFKDDLKKLTDVHLGEYQTKLADVHLDTIHKVAGRTINSVSESMRKEQIDEWIKRMESFLYESKISPNSLSADQSPSVWGYYITAGLAVALGFIFGNVFVAVFWVAKVVYDKIADAKKRKAEIINNCGDIFFSEIPKIADDIFKTESEIYTNLKAHLEEMFGSFYNVSQDDLERHIKQYVKHIETIDELIDHNNLNKAKINTCFQSLSELKTHREKLASLHSL